MGLFLGFLSYFIGLYFCFCASTILSWWLKLCSIGWSQEGWFLQLHSSFSRLLCLFGVFCVSIWIVKFFVLVLNHRHFNQCFRNIVAFLLKGINFSVIKRKFRDRCIARSRGYCGHLEELGGTEGGTRPASVTFCNFDMVSRRFLLLSGKEITLSFPLLEVKYNQTKHSSQSIWFYSWLSLAIYAHTHTHKRSKEPHLG